MKNPAILLAAFIAFLASMMPVLATNSISSASMTVEAYKEVPVPNGVFDVQVCFLDAAGVSTSVSGIGRTFDVSSRDLSSLSRVFVVSIKSNYGSKVKFVFRFSPFVNQIDKTKTVSANYRISSESQSWNEVYSGNYYYRFISAFSPDITLASIPETGGSNLVSVDYFIKGEKYSWQDYSYESVTLGSGIVNELGDEVLEANIYGSLLVDEANFEPNVDYVSTVVISLEVL